MRNRLAMFLLGATLALGFAWSARIIANAAVKVTKKDTIRVKGTASRTLNSDFACWDAQLAVRAKTLPEAYQTLELHRKKANDFILKSGFKTAEVTFERIGIINNYKSDAKGNPTQELIDYTLLQSIKISSKDVYSVEKLSRNFTELIKEGLVIHATDPIFLVQELEKFKMELLAEATRNGKERADILANNTNGAVGNLLSASQGIFQVLAPGSGEISDYGTSDKSTIKKELRAVVTLEFSVK